MTKYGKILKFMSFVREIAKNAEEFKKPKRDRQENHVIVQNFR